jgi:glycosyltransferase involved in cell wall biosynthesis
MEHQFINPEAQITMTSPINRLERYNQEISLEKTRISNIDVECHQRIQYKISDLLQMLRYGHNSRVSLITESQNPISLDVGLTIQDVKRLSALRGVISTGSVLRCIGLIAHASGGNIFGGERSFLDMARGIFACGFRLVAILPSSTNKALISELSIYAETIYTFPYPQDRHAGDLDCIESIFHSIALSERIEVFYTNTIALSNICRRLKNTGFPVVTHVRETPLTDQYLCDAFNCTADEMIYRASASSDLLICNSKFTASQFEASSRDIAIIPNIVSTRSLDAIAKHRMSCDQHPSFPLRISIISSNIPKKGLSDFFYIARQCEDLHLPFVFQIYGPSTSYLEDLIAEYKPTSLHVCGYVQDPAEALANTDMLMSLSHFSESFGRTVLEALSACIPVIAYDNGAIPELICSGENGYLVEYKQPDKVVQVLKSISDNVGELKELAKNAYSSSAMYSFSNYCNLLKSAILSVKPARYSYRANSKDVVLQRSNRNVSIEQSTLRVAYFLWHFPVPSETFVLNELEELSSRGVNIIVFCRNSPYIDFKPSFNVEVIKVASHEELALKLKDLKISVVHSHFAYPTVTDMVWPACELAQIPFTFIAHAQDIFRYDNMKRNHIDKISQSMFCRKIFAPSNFHKTFMIEQGVVPEKISKLANSIKVESYVSKPRSPNSLFRIVAINRFVEKKGIEPLIRAAQLLPRNFHILIYGYGELEEKYRTIIADNTITNVELAGSLSGREELTEVLTSCDLFVAPYSRAINGDMDGIPTILMEALAAKSIVLTTATSGIPDLIVPGFNGFYCDCTPTSIAQAIKTISELPDDFKDTVRVNGYSTVNRSYNVRRSVNKLLRIWQNKEIDICIVAWNNVVETPKIIERIHAYTDSPYHLIVCDNSSTPVSRLHLASLYLKNSSCTSLIFGHDNAYVGPGTNKCLEIGSASVAIYICGKEGFLFDHGWEDLMTDEILRDDEKIGLTGTLCYSPTYFLAKDYKGINLFPKFRGKEYIESNPNIEMSHIQGGLFAISRDMINQIGGFSAEVPHNYTDVEYSLYAQSRGWGLSEATELVSLFNKTRPGIFSRIDSQTKALHPPRIEDIDSIQSLISGRKVICNLCETIQDPPDSALFVCGHCKSSPADRALFRILVDGDYLHRRLPALLIGVQQESLANHFKTHFQGRQFSVPDFCNLTATDRLDNPSDRFELIVIHLESGESIHQNGLMEVARVAKPGGLVLIWDPDGNFSHALETCTPAYWYSQEIVKSDYVYRPSTLPIVLMSKRHQTNASSS